MSFTSAAKFAEIASRAYGDGYINRVAAAHGIALRTVHRWASGQREVPEPILAAMREIGDVLHDQHVRDQLRGMLEQWMKEGVSAFAMAGLLRDLAHEIKPEPVLNMHPNFIENADDGETNIG